MDVLPKRFGKYGLSLHPEKTRLADFRHPWVSRVEPGTFDFLGFTYYWGKTRKGGFAIKKQTASKELRLKLKNVHEWCKTNRHKALEWQHAKLCSKLQGHYAFYGVTGNIAALAEFRHHVICIWRYWLNRRSRKRDGMSWARLGKLLVAQ